MSRPNRTIVRDTSFTDFQETSREPSWMNDYLAAVEKYSVKSKQEDAQLFNQINQILGNSKSKYSSVEEAVLDMQKRTGLYDLLQKTAAEQPELFKTLPQLKDFIDARIHDHPGSAVDAIVAAILEVPLFKNSIPSGEDMPSDVKKYINNKKAEFETHNPDKNNYTGLGETNLELDNNTVRDNNPLNVMSPTSF